MVASVTNLGRSGLYDWLIQRTTAVILAAYTLFMLGYFITTPDLGYAEWSALFESTGMRIFTLLALLSFGAHSWIGLWTVFTDYLTEYMLGSIGNVVRPVLQIAVVLTLVVYAIWVIQVIWG